MKEKKDFREAVFKDCNKRFRSGKTTIWVGRSISSDLAEDDRIQDILDELDEYRARHGCVALKDLLKDLYESYDPIPELRAQKKLASVKPRSSVGRVLENIDILCDQDQTRS